MIEVYTYKYRSGEKFKLKYDGDELIDPEVIEVNKVINLNTKEVELINISFDNKYREDGYIDKTTLIAIQELLRDKSGEDIEVDIQYKFEGTNEEGDKEIIYLHNYKDFEVEIELNGIDGKVLTYRVNLSDGKNLEDEKNLEIDKEVYDELYLIEEKMRDN